MSIVNETTGISPQEELIHLCSHVPTGNQTKWQEPMKEKILALLISGACLWQVDENGLTPIDKDQAVRNGKGLRRFLDLLIIEIKTTVLKM